MQKGTKKEIKVGIVGWSLGDNSFGATKPYLAQIRNFGGTPIILSPMQGVLKELSLIVLPGGRDTMPWNYGQMPGFYNSEPDPFKEFFIKNNLQQYIDLGVPIWGTCLGMQQLNVFFGGKLDQHIDTGNHGVNGSDRTELVHPLEFEPEWRGVEKSLLDPKVCKQIFKKDEQRILWSNSLHHQGVPMKGGVAPGLEVIASSGGYVEALKHKELPIMACQFHVEEDYNDLGVWMFEQIMDKARAYDQSDKQSKEGTIASLGN